MNLPRLAEVSHEKTRVSRLARLAIAAGPSGVEPREFANSIHCYSRAYHVTNE
jgi:hypothetical protein